MKRLLGTCIAEARLERLYILGNSNVLARRLGGRG